MNRLEYLAHNGDPEQIISEVMRALEEKDEEIAELRQLCEALKEEIRTLRKRHGYREMPE